MSPLYTTWVQATTTAVLTWLIIILIIMHAHIPIFIYIFIYKIIILSDNGLL